MPNLLLIESPGKIKKLKSILGSGWDVKASMGHIRELADDGQDNLGFDLIGDRIETRFVPRDARGKKTIAELRQATKNADRVFLATDMDREGETIAWHLKEALGLKQAQRVVYSEITQDAVRRAIANPRPLDQSMVSAGLARACLDKLVGYRGSKRVVWPLNLGAKSMGRVQSATLHLICERERQIINFSPQDYWSVWVEYQEGFKAFYKKPKSKPKAVEGEETTALDDTGEAQDGGKESDRVLSQAEADRLVAIARANPHTVVKVESKLTRQSPPPAFTTSSLQQASGAKLKFSPDRTMQIAQKLYEAGHITYMRTDSVALSPEFQAEARKWLEAKDPSNIPKQATKHHSKGNAQEAHEAIRPTHLSKASSELRQELSQEEFDLYVLIWKRSLAALCAQAEIQKTTVLTQSGDVQWEARGQMIQFLGYAKYWNNLQGDAELPSLEQGQPLTLAQAGSEKKQTQPPPRYSEPKLVQVMEQKGVGRPSTYAPTIKTLKDRKYVETAKGKLQPTEMGMELDTALNRLVPELLSPEFTAEMESQLDAIAHGKQDWQKYLAGWNQSYFEPALDKAARLMGELAKPVDPSAKQAQVPQVSEIVCPRCQRFLWKVSSKSKNLQSDHFLSCNDRQGGCGLVMFWNAKLQSYVLPKSQGGDGGDRPSEPAELSDHDCPVCGSKLEQYHYQKDGQDKVMLRCSNAENRKKKCKEVSYFKAREGKFWSPKYGELGSESPAAAATPTKTRAKSKSSKPASTSKPSSRKPRSRK